MPKYRVRMTRLIEEACEFWVNGPNPDVVTDRCLEFEYKEVAEAIWDRTESEPENYGVEVELAQDYVDRLKDEKQAEAISAWKPPAVMTEDDKKAAQDAENDARRADAKEGFQDET